MTAVGKQGLKALVADSPGDDAAAAFPCDGAVGFADEGERQ